jgi:hypothetical protein
MRISHDPVRDLADQAGGIGQRRRRIQDRVFLGFIFFSSYDELQGTGTVVDRAPPRRPGVVT